MTWMLAFSAVFAGPIDRYPVCAEVVLPPAGVHRIAVPLALRSREDPRNGTDLVLFDGDGNELSFARAEGRTEGGMQSPRSVSATDDPYLFLVDPGALPVEALSVTSRGVQVARVSVRDAAGVLADNVLVWQIQSGTSVEVPFRRATVRPLEVRIEPVASTRRSVPNPDIQVRRSAGPVSPPHVLEVPLSTSVLQENGWQRYDLVLPRALPVDRVRFDTEDLVFSRGAGLVAVSPFDGRADETWFAPDQTTRVSRIRVGNVSVEQLAVPREPLPGEAELALLIDVRSERPLRLTKAVVEIDGVELVVMDPGPGPFRLCGGAPAGTSLASDLGIAMPELVRLFGEPIVPGAVQDNVAFVPPEGRSGLAGPGPELARTKFNYAHTVTGAGLVRIALPMDVQRYAQAGLSDLRLLLDDGRQLPYLLNRGASVPVEVTMERREVGGQSRIAVRLPQSGLPINRIELNSSASLFDRRVAVATGDLVPIRTVQWRGEERPNVLALSIDHPLDKELLVTIDNGSDPPLPIESIAVHAATWEITTTLPEGESVSVVYGARGLPYADYDLTLVSESVRRRAVGSATLGPRTVIRKPPLSRTDRAMLALGFAVLAASLLALCADLLRRMPKAPGDDPAPEPA